MADIIDHRYFRGSPRISIEFDPFVGIRPPVLDDRSWHPRLGEDFNQGILDEWAVPPIRDLESNALAIIQSYRAQFPTERGEWNTQNHQRLLGSDVYGTINDGKPGIMDERNPIKHSQAGSQRPVNHGRKMRHSLNSSPAGQLQDPQEPWDRPEGNNPADHHHHTQGAQAEPGTDLAGRRVARGYHGRAQGGVLSLQEADLSLGTILEANQLLA
jgi:hypothetical protein